MQSSLLLTKFRAPPPPRHLLHRARLVDALESGVPETRLTLIAAPAGYGKTTLLADWTASTTLPVAWLTADTSDNDPDRFLRYLFAAWESVQPAIRNATPGVLLGGMLPDVTAVLTALANVAASSANEMALVIDDAHLIESLDVFDALEYLVDHLPPTMHVVIAGRSEPPLPLARYRARQDALDIGADDLQFTVDESRSLLNDAMKLSITTEDATRLHDRLEGWAAGLQMASLTLRAHDGAKSTIAIGGRHRIIADFLRDEVLAGLPHETRQFLLQTSIADQLCASLCNAITGSHDSQAMLERLERDHLFTMPLDANREWYRYHRLFADYLRDQAERELPGDIARLHRRAGTWYFDQDLPDQAFDHAIAAGAIDLVTQVLERHALVRLFGGQLAVLLSWNDAIPDDWFAIEPPLGIFRSAVLFATGQMDACSRCLDDVEQAIRASGRDMPSTQARVTAIRCFVACSQNELEQAEALADTALETLPRSDGTFRFSVCGALGDTYRRNGHWVQAQQSYLRAIDHRDTPASRVQSVHAFGALADLALRRGKLREAAGFWRRALTVIEDQHMWGAYPLPVIGWVHIRLGEILYEWNDLAAAQDHLDQGRERATLGGDPHAIIAGAILAARVMLARGHIAGARETLEQVGPTVENTQVPEWNSAFERCQVALWLAQGELTNALAWADTMLAQDAALPDREPAMLAAAHALIAAGDATSSNRALALLDQVADSARVEGRLGVQIEALALQSLARWSRGDRASALMSLEQALRLAEPESYTRLFIDLGLAMGHILQELRNRNVMPAYVDALWTAFGPVSPGKHMSPRLTEPLSQRERDVLRQLAAGLTNREIAEQLYISPETVKKHTGSIYGKLGVHSRLEAVTLARELHLLD